MVGFAVTGKEEDLVSNVRAGALIQMLDEIGKSFPLRL
jgi:hypothetical protein